MVLPEHIPDEADEKAAAVMENRLPNYCPECGDTLAVAGGRVQSAIGWYEHLDPVVTCSRACVRYRFTAGTEDGGAEGREYRVAPGADEWTHFDGIVGYCDLHDETMEITKDLRLNGTPTRQMKCPECDREAVIQDDDAE